MDTWGVDYAYLDQAGDMIYLPHCYRDNRMGSYEADFYQAMAPEKLFDLTGVQPATINSVLQLYADLREKPHLKQIAQKVLFMPDLINYLLCGVAATEYTMVNEEEHFHFGETAFFYSNHNQAAAHGAGFFDVLRLNRRSG